VSQAPERPRIRALVLSIAVALLAIAGLAPAAQAGSLLDSVGACEDAVEQPFLRWLDPALYALAPNGDFETGTGHWTLTGGAQRVRENEPFFVHDAGDRSGLLLPPGSTATTPAMCVGVDHPTLRFFATRTAGDLLAGVHVEVLYEDSTGTVWSSTVGGTSSDGDWRVSPVLPVLANLAPLLDEGRTAVAFRFSPAGDATFVIDDVYVDPWKGG